MLLPNRRSLRKMVQVKSKCGAFVIIALCFIWYFYIPYTDVYLSNHQSGYNETKVTEKLEIVERQIRFQYENEMKEGIDVKELEKKIRQEKWKFLELMLRNETEKKYLPSIIGIGAEKCGTHALIRFIWDHPLIRMRIPNFEAHFFNKMESWQTIRDYVESMPVVASSVLLMEKTPAYFSYPPSDIPRLIKNSVPNVKLLLILCDPSKRVISDYHHEIIMGSITKSKHPTVEDYLQEYMPKVNKFRSYPTDDEDQVGRLAEELLTLHRFNYKTHLLTTGFYALHLTRWFQHFDSSNLFIVNGDELMHSPGRVIERLQDFLHIPKLLLEEDFVQDPETGFYCIKHPITNEISCLGKAKMRTRNGRTNYSEETMRKLRSLYKLPNEHLYELIGQRFEW